MRRRPTIQEQVWPKDSSFDSLRAWPQGFSQQVLQRVWQAIDCLIGTVLIRVRDFLTCMSSPFSHEAGLIAYVLGVEPDDVLLRIGLEIVLKSDGLEAFANRFHRFSEHTRVVPAGKPYPVQFRCHHLLMPISEFSTLSVDDAPMD